MTTPFAIRAVKAAQEKMKEGGLENYLEEHNLQIEQMNQGNFNPFTGQGRTIDAATQIINQAQRRNISLGQAANLVQTYEVDMSQAGIFATLFRRHGTGVNEGGWEPEVTRNGRLVDSIERPVQVTDIFNVIRTDQAAVKYMQEVNFDNKVTEIAETPTSTETATTAASGYYPESALKVDEVMETIYKLGTHIPVTQEQLDDVGFVRAYLNRRIPFMMRQTIDGRLLAGPKETTQLTGLMNRDIMGTPVTDTGPLYFPGFTRQGDATTIAAGAHLTTENFNKPLNALLRAQSVVMYTAYGIASHCIMHPNIWVVMATQESASGGYYLGNPANAFAPRVWGMPIVQAQTGVSDIAATSAAPTYGALVGDFNNWTDLVVRKDMEIQMGYIRDDFLRDLLRIKASVRLGLLVYRPQAFVKILNPRSDA